MQALPAPHDSPPQLTGDLEVDTAAAIEWLYDHSKFWLGTDGGEVDRFADDGRSAA